MVNTKGIPIYGEPIFRTTDELTKQVYQQNRQENFKKEFESDETIGALDANIIKDFNKKNAIRREQQIEETKEEIRKAELAKDKRSADYLKQLLGQLLGNVR